MGTGNLPKVFRDFRCSGLGLSGIGYARETGLFEAVVGVCIAWGVSMECLRMVGTVRTVRRIEASLLFVFIPGLGEEPEGWIWWISGYCGRKRRVVG